MFLYIIPPKYTKGTSSLFRGLLLSLFDTCGASSEDGGRLYASSESRSCASSEAAVFASSEAIVTASYEVGEA